MPEISQLKPFGKDGQLYDIRDDSKLPVSGGTITGDLEIEGDLTLDSPLDIPSGGTGASTAAGALTNLGAAAASHTHAASDISSGELPIVRGGTGANNILTAAKNLKVLSLGQAPESIPAHSDLNSYTAPGVYAITSNATAATLDHKPTDYAGTLRVWNAIGNDSVPGGTWYYVIQEYINLYGDTWRRQGTSGDSTTISWSAWNFYAGKIPAMQTNLGLGTLQTYTPTFVWSDNSTLTTSSVFGYYSQIGRILFISARCRITNLGTTGDKYLLMSLPSGYTTASTAIYPTIGNVVPPIGHTYQYLIRPAGASSSNLSIHCGGGADYPRSVMVTGYYAFMAIVPLE